MMVVRQGNVPDPGRHFLVQKAGENLWHVFMTETQIDANNIVPVIVNNEYFTINHYIDHQLPLVSLHDH